MKNLKPSFTYSITAFISIFFLWHLEIKYGFFPTDESRTLGLTQRLLFKQIPHVDFSYQSFMGSMYLHFYALLIPKYKVAILRIISALMVHYYTFNILKLTNLFNNKNTSTKIFFWISATYLNIHWYDFFIWPTIDALFVFTLGVAVLKKSNNIGLLILGFTPLLKTPFVLSVAGYIVYKNISKFKFNIFLKDAVISSIPSLVYLLITFLMGGFDNLYEETLLSPINWDYWNIWFHRLGLYEKQLIPVIFFLVGIKFIRTKNTQLIRILNISYMILFLIFLYLLNYNSWGYKPYLNLINLFLIFFIYIKNYKNLPDIFHAFFVCYILEVGAMMSMSWVYGQWLNGSLLVLIFLLLSQDFNSDTNLDLIKKLQSVFLIIFIIFSLTNVVELLNFRSQNIWKSNPGRSVVRSEVNLSYSLNDIDERYGPIFVDENTFEYLSDVHTCLEKVDSKNVSIFPDNPILYYVYGLNNPLYLDWYEVGYVGNRREYYNKVILEKIYSSNDPDTYIFLQSYRVPRLISDLDKAQVSKLNPTPWPENMEGIFEEIYTPLKKKYQSTTTECKSFTVLHVKN